MFLLFMAKVLDPLKYGFYCVDYVFDKKDRVATYYDMITAQQSMMSMLKRGVEVKVMREWKQGPEIMRSNEK